MFRFFRDLLKPPQADASATLDSRSDERLMTAAAMMPKLHVLSKKFSIDTSKGLEISLANVIEFIVVRSLTSANFNPAGLTRDQKVLAIVVLFSVGEPVARVGGATDGLFEEITLHAASTIFLPHMMKEFPKALSDASSTFNSMLADKKQAQMINAMAGATWSFLQSANVGELAPIAKTAEFLLTKASLR